MIAPQWLLDENPKIKRVLEKEFTQDEILERNSQGYNVYYLPNHPSKYEATGPVDGTHIDVFNFIFVDCDFKDGIYRDKDSFIQAIAQTGVSPHKIVDSGNGVHAYWRVSNLDAKSYLRLTRRMMRLLNTDEATTNIFQLMRLPNTVNTKNKEDFKLCEVLFEDLLPESIYNPEQLDKMLPPITLEDEKYCQAHYDKTYSLNQDEAVIDEELPPKFGKLLRENEEVKDLWAGHSDDRSKSDYRLGHLMFANGFTKDEAKSVLVNSAKALQRAPIHRRSYAINIVDKIWTFELTPDKDKLELSMSVKEILQRNPDDTIKGTPFRCHPSIDNTERGFRLGDVLGLVGGSGIGKTAFTLNAFRWFVQKNPDYTHFFVPLEEPSNNIAQRWKTMCGDDHSLHDKVHIMSNYDDNGNFRHLSFSEIREYIERFKKVTGLKVGCVVVDHIGALKKKGSSDENQDLMSICHEMKAFAVQTNTLLVMQSQTSREKAGIGDLELNKDAAYGTSSFEWYCDYLITLWQPLKRCHSEQACPTVTAYKFCKIRYKKTRKDIIQEDVPYYLYFDSDSEQLRELTQDEETSFKYFLPKATNKRKADRKTELLSYQSVGVKP